MNFLDERLPERFWAKVHPCPMSGCWLWMGSAPPEGYGRFYASHRPALAHRVAYESLIGPIPVGLQLDHLCRTPGCVNPAHLEAVTPHENAMRSASFAAINAQKTECPRGHALSGENVHLDRRGKRRCRACDRLHQAAVRARRRAA